jgi:hypothetical protein
VSTNPSARDLAIVVARSLGRLAAREMLAAAPCVSGDALPLVRDDAAAAPPERDAG